MTDKSKKGKDNKKPAAASSARSAAPKKTGRTSENSKTKATPKKTSQTVAKAKTAAKSKSQERTEPKPSAEVMKRLEKLAKKYGGQANVNVPAKPAPKVSASKSGETKVAPPKNGKVREITVKYRFD